MNSALAVLQCATIEARGAIYTRNEIVEFMLDLAGYHSDKPLHAMRLLEPSFGQGDFLFPVLTRLLAAFKNHGGELGEEAVDQLQASICAVELHSDTFERTYKQLIQRLIAEGFSASQAEKLASSWLKESDFLLLPLKDDFDFVIGNPPYVRQESLPEPLIKAYREMYSTIFDRADLYVPFIEKSLCLLKPRGVLAFICADRWMKNRYGAKLRQFVSEGYWLKYCVDMVGTDAFHSDVMAYPAITVISHEQGQEITRFAYQPTISTKALQTLYSDLCNSDEIAGGVREIKDIVSGSEPWLFELSDKITLLRRLENDFPLIEDAVLIRPSSPRLNTLMLNMTANYRWLLPRIYAAGE